MLRIANGLPDIKFALVGLGNEEIDSLWKIKLCPLPGGADVESAEKQQQQRKKKKKRVGFEYWEDFATIWKLTEANQLNAQLQGSN